MASQSHGEIMQYVPYQSFVRPAFWHTLTELKLDVDKLNETTKQIYGRFTYRHDIGTIFDVDGISFNASPSNEKFFENVTGTIVNKNTIEEFKSIDKAALLNSIGEMIWCNIKTKSWITNPACLLNFFILSFADLKKFHYYYWFAFPAPSQPTVFLMNNEIITNHFSDDEIQIVTQGYKALNPKQRPFFAIVKENDSIAVKCLAEVVESGSFDAASTLFAFEDSSNSVYAGWPLRTFLAALLEHCPLLKNSELKVVGLRFSTKETLDNSRVFTIRIPEDVQPVESAGWVGWERNDKGNFGPKLANMSTFMDPIKLAEASSDLNIRLMKWRLVPDIDVDVMKTTKCLLLGAGTLGCHVARDLLAWGFRHITFIDNGKVSYSNPTRQVLFNHTDCIGGGKRKAEAAADNLKLILPTVNSKGMAVHIPMPGHPVGESLMEETVSNINILTTAISEHDAIFLLLDTREARWLPTLLGAHFGKIVINAALGFDSYLVMRHGLSKSVAVPEEGSTSTANVVVPGADLGCYFCNDITAPGNSLKDRTLDQQCTVTRPGVAAIAGALAVELLVGMLQHPLRAEAPALCQTPQGTLPANLEGVLGAIPHSIRGFLHTYDNVKPTCTKFLNCIACSDTVVQKYREEGMDFLMNAFASRKYLEEVTGLTELHLSAEMANILTLSDEDQDD